MDRNIKEKLEKNLEQKRKILQKLKNIEEIYVLFSKCTNMPYVFCEETSYNDQIFVFDSEESAGNTAEAKAALGIPLTIVKFEKKRFLMFYSTLYEMGVNAIVAEMDQEVVEVMLEELITRPGDEQIPEGKRRLENPQLQLTVLYYMQELRKHPDQKQQGTSQLKALEEEMISNLCKGTYIVPVKDKNIIPFMKAKNGDIFQPLFTDFTEFRKFNKEQEFQAAMIPFADMNKVVAEQSKGIVMNPMGFHLIVMKEQLESLGEA